MRARPVHLFETRRRIAPSSGRGTIRLALALVLVAAVARATEPSPPPAERPKVALVLSGGGARGSAHIGVLEVLEELRVPVDYVVGTSMGAIVGGLYAAGYPASELRDTILGMDWTNALTDEIPRTSLPFRRKQDDRDFPIRGTLRFRDLDVRLPAGVVEGRNVLLELRSLTLPVATVRDFDRLPLPFRAVATDLNTGEAVTLGSGELALAMRASLSVPGVLNPVTIDGRLLVDGGVADNLPVGVARSFAPDVLIAVDVGDTLRHLDEDSSVIEIFNQVVTALMRRETERGIEALGDEGILIVPELEEIAATDFQSVAEGIEAGVRAARAVAERLLPLSLSAEDYRSYRAGIGSVFHGAPVIEAVEVETAPPIAPERVRSLIRSREGQPLDLQRLRHDLDAIRGLDLFEQVGYSLEPATGNRVVLRIETEPRTRRLTVVRFGAGLFDDFQGDTEFGLGLRVTTSRLNALGLELRVDGRVGYRQQLRVELYQPFGASFFVAPRIGYLAEDRSFYREAEEWGRYRGKGIDGTLDLGMALAGWGELRVGYSLETSVADRKEGSGGPPHLEYSEREAHLELVVDTLDEPSFPGRGSLVEARVARLFEGPFEQREADLVELSILQAVRLGRWRFAANIELGTLLDENREYYPFELGGFLRLSGFRDKALRGRHLGLLSLRFQRYLIGESIRLPVYLGASAEAGQLWMERDGASVGDLLWHGSLFLAADTYVGPAVLGVGFGEEARRSFFFSLGQNF